MVSFVRKVILVCGQSVSGKALAAGAPQKPAASALPLSSGTDLGPISVIADQKRAMLISSAPATITLHIDTSQSQAATR